MLLLNLPIELRFQISTLVAIPSVAALSDYIGLYLSCKQINAEFDQEGIRAYHFHLATVLKQYDSFRQLTTAHHALRRKSINLNLADQSHIKISFLNLPIKLW